MAHRLYSYLYFLLLLCGGGVTLHAQTFINEEWAVLGGIPDTFALSSSAVDGQGNLVVCSNTLVSGQQSDMLVVKYDRDGNLLWQDSFNGNYNGRDYGLSVAIDVYGYIYATGLTQMGAFTCSFIVRKYQPDGFLKYSTIYNGIGIYNAPTAIVADNSGNAYVAGLSYTLGTLSDYAIFKLDPNGNLLWTDTYDYANLQDAPAAISLNAAIGSLYVTGASESAANQYDYATLEYDMSGGSQLNVNRVAAPGTGFDKATSIARDNAGNLYITGQAYDTGTNSYDIKTLKLDAGLAVQWIQTYDAAGLEDLGTTVGVDATGNVYVGGYANTPNQGKNAVVLKYDTNGNLLWTRGYNNALYNGDDEALKLRVNPYGGVILGGTTTTAIGGRLMTLRYDENGRLMLLREYEGVALGGDQFDDLQIDNSGNIYVTGRLFDGTDFHNISVKYGVLDQPLVVEVDSAGNPTYAGHQLIVKFRPGLVNTAFVDDTKRSFDDIRMVVADSVVAAMTAKSGVFLGRAKAIKIFRRLTTTDTLSISRLNEPVPIPPFWSAFVITLPLTADVRAVSDSLNKLSAYIEYAQPNWLGTADNVPNDTHFAKQNALHPTNPVYNLAHININGAWDIQTGRDTIRVGVFDYPIFWMHEDFGDGTFPGSKIKGGWDYAKDVAIYKDTTIGFNHGTNCAGIIGALRNNHKGVSGIAGGDVDNMGNAGASLYSFGILNANALVVPFSKAANAVLEGATKSQTDTLWVDIMNHSWSTILDSIKHEELLKSVFKTAWRNACIVVVSRGNNNNDSPVSPASYQDEWLICVGASGTDGKRKKKANAPGVGNGDHSSSCYLLNWGSSFGTEVDLVAPGVTDLIVTTREPGVAIGPPNNSCHDFVNPSTGFPYSHYTKFNGTSAAAPHVAGVAALMLSEHHTDNGYPNNLAPEDVESLLQIYAADRDSGGVFPNGYDQYQGWGLLDATNTLQHLQMPVYRVLHNPHPNTLTLDTFPDTVISLGERVNDLAAGEYNAYKVEVTETFQIPLPSPNSQLLHHWLRGSSTWGTTNLTSIYDRAFATIDTPLILNGTAFVTTTTACWYVISDTSGQPVQEWIPNPPSQARTAFSLHLYDPGFTSIYDEMGKDWELFPNPASDILYIRNLSASGGAYTLTLSDMAGNELAKRVFDDSPPLLSFPLPHIAPGIYLCTISGKHTQTVKKFIKR